MGRRREDRKVLTLEP